MIVDPYATGVLVEEVHHRLVADIEHIAEDAAIQPHWIWTPLNEVAGDSVVSWVKGFRKHHMSGVTGLVLYGPKPQKALAHMSAIAGALLRNFIHAQVMTSAQVYDRLKNGDPPNPTCLLIPNFFLGESHGIKLASWEIAALQDLLMERHLRGASTVVYATNLDAMASEYGSAVSQLILSHYTKAKIVEGTDA